MKKCSKCKKEKDNIEFYSDKRANDGLYSACRACCGRPNPRRFYTGISMNKEKYNREWRIKNKEKMCEWSKKWAINNPDKYKTQRIASDAKKNGILKRQPCEVCDEEKTEMHHDDYSKPLQVRWLCKKHHEEIHS